VGVEFVRRRVKTVNGCGHRDDNTRSITVKWRSELKWGFLTLCRNGHKDFSISRNGRWGSAQKGVRDIRGCDECYSCDKQYREVAEINVNRIIQL